MPLKPSQILTRLNAKRADFETFDKRAQTAFEIYQKALKTASSQTADELLQRLRQVASSDRGAEPLEPSGNRANWIVPAHLTWQNREQSLNWVRDRLMGVSTFAVDGSQIYPGKDLSIPIALVQIGWYENGHTRDGRYEKDVDLEVMTPADLKVSSGGEPVDRKVNMRRFEMETQRLIRYMQEREDGQNCLAFLDGSLVVTFADAFDETTRQHYIDCVARLLQASQDAHVPLVGYIDTSYASDLTLMLQQAFKLPEAASLHDAALLAGFMQWGDRTPLFRCRRPGVLLKYPGDLASQIAFTYLKAHDGFPIRLEMPIWIYEAGLHEQVIDWVRCEIIVGGGYPYAIETADQTAVLKTEDRQTFYRLLQDWAEQEKLNLRLSRKMVSKVRRR